MILLVVQYHNHNNTTNTPIGDGRGLTTKKKDTWDQDDDGDDGEVDDIKDDGDDKEDDATRIKYS